MFSMDPHHSIRLLARKPRPMNPTRKTKPTMLVRPPVPSCSIPALPVVEPGTVVALFDHLAVAWKPLARDVEEQLACFGVF